MGLFVGWMIWARASWVGYFIGVVVIGIGDLAFLFEMVMPDIIELNIATISGPILCFLAVGVTPFGMPPFGEKKTISA